MTLSFFLHLSGLQHEVIHPSDPFGLLLDFETLPGQLREVGKRPKINAHVIISCLNVFIIFWIHRPACTVRKSYQWRAWTEELNLYMTRHANNSLASWESSLGSLRSNGFQSSYCAKARARAKEMALFCFRPNFLDELARKHLLRNASYY